MLKRILDALGALLEDAPVFNRLIEQMKAWGESQEAARKHLISVLTNVVATFERGHAIVLIELSRLAAADTPEEYKRILTQDVDRAKLYDLFKANEVCGFVHELQAELQSGFGDIKESIVLGAARQLDQALGRFEQGEYTLAQQYQDHLSQVLLGVFQVNDPAGLQAAKTEVVAEQVRLSEELAELTRFKRRILQLSLYDT